MPSYDQASDLPKKGKIIKSAYESESFEADGTIHVDGLVGSATISPSGRDIALASPDGLAIIDLDSPYSPPRRLRSHGMPWLVVDVQWSPFAGRDYWVVSTANHRALVWNLNMREDSNSGAIEHSLQGHSRAITDINFSAHHPDLLATCSVDGYVHHWDLRRPRQPALTFCDWFAGATQVKYNRQDPHIMASAHDRWLHIWDERKAGEPLKSISAHTSKIYGIDWNRTRPTGIVTCSLDKSIKFWDYESNFDEPEQIYRTNYPVWRARHTPFGWGMLAMPQNAPGDLYLYDRRWEEGGPIDVQPDPVAVFPGHGDYKTKEFLWRSRGGITADGADDRDFQLVTWGTDNELRLHCVESSVLSSVGHQKGNPARKGFKLTRQGAKYKTFRTVEDTASWDKKAGTMSDPRPGTVGAHRSGKSALTVVMRSGLGQGRAASQGWRGPSMKARAAPDGDKYKNQSQIGWMKGISMTKRKGLASNEVPKRQASKDSTTSFAHGYPDDRWGEPDTIQEELLRISQTIPKVSWDNIDMDNLTLQASLNGPWGANGETIFIKIQIDIPSSYPKLKAPKFTIEKTSFMPEETHKRIQKEIHLLANQFLQRRDNCLEVAFTYLLGEVDLESSTTFFKNVQDLDDDIGGMDDESSSEDEDIPPGGSASMSQELPPRNGIDSGLAMPHHPVLPPPPGRSCGARFAADGRLVCFFPSREEKARALVNLNSEAASKDRQKGEPFFAGFGRLTSDVPSRQKLGTDDASALEDQTDESDEDESSSSSSSDSESTSIHKMSLWYHSKRQLKQAWSEDRSVRSSGGGTGTGVGTGTGTQFSRRRILGKPRNIVAVHDIAALLPSKRELAREYAIFGDGADVCEHNARVAEKHGFTELIDIWWYLALLLRTGIPLALMEANERRESILVIARDVVAQSGPEMAQFQRPGQDASLLVGGLSGRVKWGEHPLAQDFIADLFDYFEKIADVQMLAMLSCIFSEASIDDSVAYIESQLPAPDKPLSMKTPSFSLDYFPTDASTWHLSGRKSQVHSAATTPGTVHTPIHYGGSQASEDAISNGGETAVNSYGESSPLKTFDGETANVSRSPRGRSFVKQASGLGSNFAVNLSRSFTASSTNSPPNQTRKRPSPAEILSSLAPSAVGWGPSTASTEVGHRRVPASDDDYRREDPGFATYPTEVSVSIEDQAIFDDDGWLSTPLLRSYRTYTYANYRYAYAEMLQLWDQPLARLEIMKFSVLKDDHAPDHTDGSYPDVHDGSSYSTARPARGSSPIPMGKKDQLYALIASGRGLDVTGVCQIHETQLEPLRYNTTGSKMGGAVGSCERCHRQQSQLRCVYCLEPIDALYPPCLSCGCASHPDCLAEWHAAGEVLCPAGDECNCVEEAIHGTVESWSALRGAVAKSGMGTGENTPVAASDDEDRDKNEWERVDRHVPARWQGQTLSPPSLSIGRLKKQAGEWSRGSNSR